jgi:hypothetical protein
MERYYQIAAASVTKVDRPAEFTQVDMELSFVQPEIFEVTEALDANTSGCRIPAPKRRSSENLPTSFMAIWHR